MPDIARAGATGTVHLRDRLAGPRRALLVFDRAGVLRDRFESLLRLGRDVDRAIAAVERLRAGEP